MNKTNLAITLIVVACLILVGRLATTGSIEQMGIYGHDSGNASLVVGEACTINMDSSVDPVEAVQWCIEMQAQHYNK